MLINSENLQGLTTAFRAAFQSQFDGVESKYGQVATVIPSSTSKNTYPWLGEMPSVREWIGDRMVHKLAQHDYTITNKEYELTVEVKRTAIEDDQYGIYTPMIADLGHEAAIHPDRLVFALLMSGFIDLCYDGQPFFDPDHPGFDKDGKDVSVSNMQAGSKAPWFLLDTRRPLKPLIYQNRKSFQFVARDNPEDPKVFDRAAFTYGVDGRANAGFGFWQTAFGSQAELTSQNFEAACEAMGKIRKKSGEPAGVNPNLLVVGTSNKAAAKKLIKAQLIDGGNSNTNYEAVDLLAVEWLD